MRRKNIFITDLDRQRLGTLLHTAHRHTTIQPNQLHILEGELEHAKCADPSDVPHDLVTMNSTVELHDMESEKIETYTLAYPEDAEARDDCVCVLTPLGTAILGRCAGEIIEVRTERDQRMKIARVSFQPERDGQHSL